MASVHDWQSYQASVLAQLGSGTSILYRPCREHLIRVTDYFTDDSIKDHKRLAVIFGPGFTGLTSFFLTYSSLLSCLSNQFLMPAFTGKKTLFIKLRTGSAPAIYLTQQMTGNNSHRLSTGHIHLVFFGMVIVTIELSFSHKRQRYRLQDLSQQPSPFFTNLVLPLESAALTHSKLKPCVPHQLTPIGKVTQRPSFGKQSRQVLFRDKLRVGGGIKGSSCRKASRIPSISLMIFSFRFNTL